MGAREKTLHHHHHPHPSPPRGAPPTSSSTYSSTCFRPSSATTAAPLLRITALRLFSPSIPIKVVTKQYSINPKNHRQKPIKNLKNLSFSVTELPCSRASIIKSRSSLAAEKSFCLWITSSQRERERERESDRSVVQLLPPRTIAICLGGGK